MSAQQPRQRLYLVTPPLNDTAAFARDLGLVLDAGDIAALLLRLAAADERTLINRTKAITAVVQRRDIAVLLDGHPDIAARAGADGAHLTGIEALTAAIGSLKPDRIAGCGGLRSRHDAMLAGQAGADYVMFGEPNQHGSHPPFDALEERIAWWAGLFEIPCVGYASGLDEVAPLARAKADFVALGDWIWTNETTAAATVAAATASLAEAVAPQ
ncbi:MAG TPA: thiamine phosphate synthase [Xanthobacteraceae bacterium]|nr:thiamine phosphate synthase [Xanthobacteraceae bacterium]